MQDRIGRFARQVFVAGGLMAVVFLTMGAFLGITMHQPAAAADCDSMASPRLDWSECHKNNIILQGSDLHGANLQGTHFDSTDLSDTNLKSADFEKATMIRTWLTNAHAEGANFARIEAYRSSFAKIVATGASFVAAELERADFTGATLQNTDFEKAELGRANFDKADIGGASFSLANLSRANFAGAFFKGHVGFDRAFMYLTRIEGADLSTATNLTQSQLDLACGDKSTKLPAGLKMPTSWPCAPDEKD